MGGEREPRRIRWRVTSRDSGRRLDHFLKERIPRMSRARIQEAIRTRVTVAGRARVRPSTRLSAADEVTVTWPDTERAPDESPSAGAGLDLLYCDDAIVVVDKPAGLLSHGTTSSRGPTLLGALALQGFDNLQLVHRLDRETSGVLALGRTRDAGRALSKAFASGRAVKTYVAIVFGEVRREEGMIDLPLGAASGSSVHIKQGVDAASGKRAMTAYRVLRRMEGFTLLELCPRTGRRHQIRVHLQAVGHPVVGDKLYGSRESHHLRFLAAGFDEKMRRDLLSERQLLHALRLEIPHPVDGRSMNFEAPLPADMQDFLSR